MKPYTSDFKPFPIYSYPLLKIYLHFHDKRIFIETWYILLYPPPSSCYNYTLSTILSFSSFAFK